MSNNKDSGADSGEGNICRDFLRNVCTRGDKCKFNHPNRGETQRDEGDYQFCHDYQNSECRRSTCKFIHCSRAEQDYYKESGKLPPALEDMLEQGLRGYGSGSAQDGDIPICRDYMKGQCNRGSGCKFRHLSRGDMEYEERRQRVNPPPPPPPPYRGGYYSEYESDRMRRPRYDSYYGERPPPPPTGARPSGARPTEMRELEDENVMLRRKIDDLRKQVSDLTATNEVLLDQNARLRANKEPM